MNGQRFTNAAYGYLYIGDYDSAKRAFERAIADDPANPERYFHASITAHRSGHLEDALTYARQAVELAAENPLYISHYNTVCATLSVEAGKLAYVKGDLLQALQYYEEAIKLDPLHEDARKLIHELCAIHPDLLSEEEDVCVRFKTDTCSNCWCDRPDGEGSCQDST